MSSKVAAAFAATRLPIFRQALANPFRTALIAKGTTFTYGQLLANAEVVRKRVLKGSSSRIDPADPRRIAFLYPPGFDYVSAQWGIWAAGAISVPLCTSHPPPELEYTVTDSGADTVFFGKEFSEKIGALQKTLTGVKWIDLLGKDESGGLVQEIAAEPVIAQSQGALLIYTSGTTGKPKGVLTTHANIGAQAQSLITAWKWQAEDRLLHVLPLHHIHGIINALTCPLWLGASCEFMKFDARAVWDRWMRSERNLTIFMAVPTVYAKLIQEYEKMDEETQVLAREACSQFRLMVSGSAALPDPVFKAWEKISGHKLLERYGMTEIGMALGNPLEGPRIPGTVGFPFPGVKISLRDDNGKVVDPSHKDETSGELFVGGPQVFVKYWNRPDATASDLRDGWFRTGDMVARTPDGVHRILGRSSVDVIKTGGYKVSALEIERELFAHCDVADVAVLGIPDDTWGETICCLLVLKDGNDEEKTVETLKASLKAIMAPYKVPRKWKVIKELPRNAMGKVNKKALKPQFQDVGAGQKRTRQRPSPPSKRAKFEASQDGGPHTPTPSSPITTPSGVAKADVIAELSLVTASKPFKNPAYNAPKAVKKLKQIAALEKGLDVPPDFPTYWNIEAMPSFRPQKKYCDITGLECRETQAPYTDPKTGLRYHNSDVYQYIRTFQPQHVQAYLELRNAAVKL